jgi:hypothetical protein
MRNLLIGLASVALFATVSSSQAQSKRKLVIEGFAGNSLGRFLGSEDHRIARGFGVGTTLNAPRKLTIKGTSPDLILLGYRHRSTTQGFYGHPPNGTDAYGILGLSRYQLGKRVNGVAWYGEIGFGFQLFDQATIDQSSTWSFSPTFGLGTSIYDSREREFYVGVRFFHLSNAGLRGNNKGQNQLLLTMGVRL